MDRRRLYSVWIRKFHISNIRNKISVESLGFIRNPYKYV